MTPRRRQLFVKNLTRETAGSKKTRANYTARITRILLPTCLVQKSPTFLTIRYSLFQQQNAQRRIEPVVCAEICAQIASKQTPGMKILVPVATKTVFIIASRTTVWQTASRFQNSALKETPASSRWRLINQAI